MKLLMTADAVGGVWTYATELARALRPLGWDVTIAVMGPASSPGVSRAPSRSGGQEGLQRRVERADPFEVIHTGLALDWLASGPEPVHHAAAAIAEIARDVRADVVQLNSPALAAGARFPCPVVAVAHGCVGTWWEATHPNEPLTADLAWHPPLVAAGLRAADALVAPSRAYAEAVARRYALPALPIAIPNGRTLIALPDVAPAPHAFTAGRLWDRAKRTDLLDRVAAEVPIRAAGPVSAPHGETVATEHLQLLGTLDTAGLARELAARPVFVSAASFEPFGLAVLEAAQAGCPLVLADQPVFRELWDGAAIFAHDEVGFGHAIAALLADPAVHREVGERARTRAARYTPTAQADAMAALYASLLSRRRAAA